MTINRLYISEKYAVQNEHLGNKMVSCENVSFKPKQNWGKCSCKLDKFLGDSEFLFTLPFGKLT